MNTNDTILRQYLFDFNNLKKVAEFYPTGKASLLISQAEYILNNDLYSDINAQDEDGNTFLHCAFNSKSLKLVEILFSKGANLLLENNNKITPLNLNKYYDEFTQNYRNSLKKIELEHSFKQIGLDFSFKTTTKGYHPKTKEFILRFLLRENKKLHGATIKQFLEENDLSTIPNIITLVQHSIDFALTKENIDFFNTLSPTQANHTKLLYNGLVMQGVGSINSSQQEDYLHYLKNTQFEVNQLFMDIFLDAGIVKIVDYDNTHNEYQIKATCILFEKLLEQNYTEIPDIGDRLIKFDELLSKYPPMLTLFSKIKLEKMPFSSNKTNPLRKI